MANNTSQVRKPRIRVRAEKDGSYTYTLSDNVPKVDLTSFFGPGEPLPPQAPADVVGRRFDYDSYRNLVNQPRGEERISFEQLRALVRNYDLLGLVVQERKNQIASQGWMVRAKDPQKRKQEDPRIDVITQFLRRPDREHAWNVWIKALVEEMMVTDALTVWPRRTFDGSLYALELIDGATIVPIIDDHGRRPISPAPAYQQVIKGLPAADYTADALLYLPQSWSVDRVYGFPPVEQVIMTVNIAMRRQMHQLQYYTEGTVPDALIGVPETWSPDQISQFQTYWDALLTNNTAVRRHVRFVPAGISKSFIQTKEAALKDDYDEWLARILCKAFGVSYQWAVKMMSRASAQNASDESDDGGDQPWMQSVKEVMTRLIEVGWDAPDLEFAWQEEVQTDALKKAQTDQIKLQTGTKKINEVRLEDGLEPDPNGNELLIYTPSGAMTLESVLHPPEPTPAPIGHNGGPPIDDDEDESADPDGDEGSKLVGGKMVKAADAEHRPLDPDRPAAVRFRNKVSQTWSTLLEQEGNRIAGNAGALQGRMQKADDGAGEGGQPDPLDSEAWRQAGTKTGQEISDMAQDGLRVGAAALGTDELSIVSMANPHAVAWAQAHAAELINDLEGTTRDALAKLVTQSETEGWGTAKLAKAIREDAAFSPERAALIAHMEQRTADNQGALQGWKAAAELGVKVQKRWLPRGVNVCLECLANVAMGAIDVTNPFPSGALTAPGHVHCECDVEAVIEGDD